jgi:putative membrane protein
MTLPSPDLLLALLHHLIVFALVAVLFAQYVLLGNQPDAARLRTVGQLDKGYAALAVGILAIGFARAAHGAKGWAFYADNPVFWAKIGVFALIGLLSVVPTVRFLRWQKQVGMPDATAWRATHRWILAELLLLPLLPLLAILMARGIGL